MKFLRPLFFGIVLASAFYWFTTHHQGTNPVADIISRPTHVELSEAAGPEKLDPEEQNNIEVYRRVIPSVVNITSKTVAYDFFFGPVPQEGQGSGFIIDKEGHILTNYHVVGDSSQLDVTLHNKKTYRATVIGRDRAHDLAVIQIKAPEVVAATLGESKNLQVGQKVFAIGNPFGLSGTMTRGIISSLRPIRSPEGAYIEEAIQTDAAINPGNSGGALVDMSGALIGVSAAMAAAGGDSPLGPGGSIGLGFAIPVDQAKRIADQLIATGKASHATLGVQVSSDATTHGAKIVAVAAGGPAAAAGLPSGAVVTKADDRIIDSANALVAEVRSKAPGDKITLTYSDPSGAKKTAQVTLGSAR